MIEFSPSFLARISPALLVLILAACSPEMIDALTALNKDCESGIPVATESYLLDKDQQLAVGGNGIGHNIITSKGNGDFTVKPVNPDIPPTNLDDGRVIVENIEFGPNDLIAISHSRSGKFTKIEASMNCKDSTLIPPK